MTDLAREVERRLTAATATLDLSRGLEVRGVVTRVADDVAWVAGLDRVGYEELVVFDSGALGMALDLGTNTTGVALLTRGKKIGTGEGAKGLMRLPALPVGADALGRILDPLGAPLDGGPPASGVSASPCHGSCCCVRNSPAPAPLRTAW